MQCEYYAVCPSATGWCKIHEYDESCVFHLQVAIRLLKEENKKLEQDKQTLWNVYKYR